VRGCLATLKGKKSESKSQRKEWPFLNEPGCLATLKGKKSESKSQPLPSATPYSRGCLATLKGKKSESKSQQPHYDHYAATGSDLRGHNSTAGLSRMGGAEL